MSVSAGAQELQLRKAENLNLAYYGKAPEYLSYHLARSFENSMAFHERLFNYAPTQPVTILLQDWGDFGHGGTSTLPWNYISLGMEPFIYTYDTMPTNERMNWLMHHELVHVVATDKAAGRDLTFRKLFHGKVEPGKENPLSMYYSYLTAPRWYAPRWYHEGIATFLETWMAGGVGRALGGYDEMVFRTMVMENAYFYDVVGLESEGTTIDFQVGQNSYLYGTRFVTYLGMKYGPEKVVAWFDRKEGSAPNFSTQFEKVFGCTLEQEWHAWIAWEAQWQAENLARIRKYPVTQDTRLIPEALGSVSRSFYDPGRKLIYTAVRRPARTSEVVSLDPASGQIKPLAEVVAPAFYLVTSMAYDPKGDKLFFTSHHQAWRDLEELDLATGRTRTLMKGARIGDLAADPSTGTLWGIRHFNGLSSLVRVPKPYDGWITTISFEYGSDMIDLDVSPDGRTLTGTLIEVSGQQRLVAFDIGDLMKGDHSFTKLHEFKDNAASNFTFSPDGRYLYGTSYYTGASNIFRYDFETRKMEAITNSDTGYFRPIPLPDGGLLAYRYTAKGFLPVRLPVEVREDIEAIKYLGQQVVERFPIVKSWNAGSPARVDLDKVTTYLGPYKAGKMLGLGSVYPVLEGYKDAVAAGLRWNFSDPLGRQELDVTAAYSPDHRLQDSEKLHLKVLWVHEPWKVRLAENPTDFYDLFGPTKVSRKGQTASVAFHHNLIYDRPRTLDYTLTGAYYGGLDTLPDYQNVRAPFSHYASLGGHLDYKDLRRTLGAVEDERGIKWTLAADVDFVNGHSFERYHGGLDAGVLLPLDHSSIWLRTAAGGSNGAQDSDFSRFFFGGFGNNYVDYQDVRRYREFYAFPGLDLNQVGGSDFGKATLEWTLPPIRFRRLGTPGLFANWARFALFTSYLATDLGAPALRQNVRSLGTQVDISLTLFSDLESTLSFGYAMARSNGRNDYEVMASLKLLR
ncbi:MAG TPA: hypothetical protein VJ483_06745 [Holophagaceae bacterium]|nr:hypothetical protein [Holophagaceae bacterium]